MVRTNRIYPHEQNRLGALLCRSFDHGVWQNDAVKKALDARDGVSPSLLTNASMMDAMRTVDSEPLWSILDEKGTQTMMRQLLGEAGSVTDFESGSQAAAGLMVLEWIFSTASSSI